ncbi:Exonuclease III [Sinosporangium album]|uniref:Exonuclease III n=1 Tax=Sinosporangium album TaxID=504805 RepID=A0A1G8ICF0_9ACTN|nr:endonuclease/exonuclease/phosphatase family protein [Sinosporangium album]SDI16566.1 Exonuclease III [Sinosporangium album]
MLGALTVNIGAASRGRAERILHWLSRQPDDVFLLTETSSGDGTAYLLKQFAHAGFAVVHTPGTERDRGAALVSRVPILPLEGTPFDRVSLPGRVALAALDTDPATWFVSVYVPSRDRSEAKTSRKEAFITSFLAALAELPIHQHDHLVIGGDYNVISVDHQPRHSGFLPFEFGLLDTLDKRGFVDAHQTCFPGEQAHSWIGRTGDGYRLTTCMWAERWPTASTPAHTCMRHDAPE